MDLVIDLQLDIKFRSFQKKNKTLNYTKSYYKIKLQFVTFLMYLPFQLLDKQQVKALQISARHLLYWQRMVNI